MTRRLLIVVPLALTFVLIPTAAQAHSVITSSQPMAGQRLGTAPGVVVLEFSEALNPKLSRAIVTDPTGERFAGGASGEDIRVRLSTNAPGVYRVDWNTVSTLDGHTWRGSFEFGVGVTPSTPPQEAGLGPRSDDLFLALGRWVEALALLLALGMLLVRRLAGRRPELDWVRTRIAPALAIALIAGLAVVWGEAMTAAGSASPSAFLSYVTTRLPGFARLVRLGLEGLALVAALVGATAVWMWLAGAIGALAASGHGAAIHPAWWGITVDAVHLLAAGVWAGGILALATQRPPGGWRSPAARELLVRFSPPAVTAFTVTVGFGAIQAIQELGTVHALVGSSYGQVLLVKIGLVALMLPLSFVAWRLRRPHFRFEGTLAVAVVAAAAVLAAYPIPPSRLVEAEAAHQATPPASALPKAGDLTMGNHAGQVLVGLTLRPAGPRMNEALVYLLPLEGTKAAKDLEATITAGGRTSALTACGDTCRQASLELEGDQTVVVSVAGSKGGRATFEIPKLPAPDGSGLLRRAQARIHQLQTYRLFETLSSGIATIPSRYAFQAPSRMESSVNQSQTVWVGDTRYSRAKPGNAWQVERGGPSIPVPSFIWDYFKPFVDPRIVGEDQIDGVRTTVVSFAGGRQGTPIWFRLWIDPKGLVHMAEMRAQGHFMDDRYYDFDAPFTITPPST